MNKIIIFYASFGMGHKSAAMALREHFKIHFDIQSPVVDFFEEFIPGFTHLVRFLYDTSIKKVPTVYGTFFRISDELSGQPLAKEIDKIGIRAFEKYLEKEKPDIIITTFPISGKIAQLKRKYGFKYFVVITDFGVHNSWVKDYIDLYFVADEKVKSDLQAKEISLDTIRVTGIPIRRQFAEKREIMDTRKKMGLIDLFTVIMIGKRKDIDRHVLTAMCNMNIQIIVVAGRDKRYYTTLKRIAAEHRNLIPPEYVEEIAPLMETADLMIGKGGGLTISEALASGLPMIIFEPIPGQEFYNVDFLVNEGAALYARDRKDLLDKLMFLSERKERMREMKKNAARLGKPLSSSDICHVTVQYVH
jgi:processive 1,2-diacylglycerol beta-glucosyltransferase